MLKIKYLLVLLLLANTVAFAQHKKADSLYQAGNYVKAGSVYLLCIKDDEFKPLVQNDYYNAACCYALSGKADSSFVLLKLAIQNGYNDLEHIKSDADLTSLHALPGWP